VPPQLLVVVAVGAIQQTMLADDAGKRAARSVAAASKAHFSTKPSPKADRQVFQCTQFIPLANSAYRGLVSSHAAFDGDFAPQIPGKFTSIGG
jgi:hypothetical protein